MDRILRLFIFVYCTGTAKLSFFPLLLWSPLLFLPLVVFQLKYSGCFLTFTLHFKIFTSNMLFNFRNGKTGFLYLLDKGLLAYLCCNIIQDGLCQNIQYSINAILHFCNLSLIMSWDRKSLIWSHCYASWWRCVGKDPDAQSSGCEKGIYLKQAEIRASIRQDVINSSRGKAEAKSREHEHGSKPGNPINIKH